MVAATDKIEIIEVLSAANRAADQKDVEAHASFYTNDGSIVGDMRASGSGEDFRSDIKEIFESEPGLKRHIGSGHIFSEDGDRVVVKSLLTVLDGEAAPSVVATADVTDELVHDGSRWKIARHEVQMDPGTKKAMGQQ